MTVLTTSQALVGWMVAQRSELLSGQEVPLFPGVYAIFGHGNVLGLGTALYEVRDSLPVWRGQTEQGMALAAIGYNKAMQRRQVMAATSSIGPGALNLVTAAGVAHANRIPLLLLPGDIHVSRAPDPVLQQVEHFGDPGASVNDAFRAVSRYFDRITKPEQLLSTLPQACGVLLDPADTGPAVIALPQDVQVETFDFPGSFFAPVVHRVRRPRADSAELRRAVEVLRSASRPLIVVGGGVRYSGAAAAVYELATAYGIPYVETTAGRTAMPDPDPLAAGPLGVTGSASANALAADADVVLAIGTRLMDFTTASWTVFNPSARLISLNVGRYDAVKRGAVTVIGDARETVQELHPLLDGWSAETAWTRRTADERATWDAYVDSVRAPRGDQLTYAEVVGVVNDASTAEDYVMTASGGFPGELLGGWRSVGTLDRGPTMDTEYGFSCMGYEVSAAWGAAMARAGTHPDGVVTTLCGDGSYLMLNSELFSAAFAGHPFVTVLCDNGGYAVIARLQTNHGGDAHNNLLSSTRGPGADAGLRVDFAAHAASLGCEVLTSSGRADFAAVYTKARSVALGGSRPVVVVVTTSPTEWTEAGAWWEVGVPPHLSGRPAADEGKATQVRWLPSP